MAGGPPVRRDPIFASSTLTRGRSARPRHVGRPDVTSLTVVVSLPSAVSHYASGRRSLHFAAADRSPYRNARREGEGVLTRQRRWVVRVPTDRMLPGQGGSHCHCTARSDVGRFSLQPGVCSRAAGPRESRKPLANRLVEFVSDRATARPPPISTRRSCGCQFSVSPFAENFRRTGDPSPLRSFPL